ncbi:hypothetical protein QYF36_011280 [Acer negundo]|nr:hypothetical protein QYF36_011280 [Acer negundo]
MAAAATLIGRNAPPSHYSITIQSFSLLKASTKKCISDDFEAEGYEWNLCIYPSGNKSRNGEDHVSIYLEFVEPDSFSTGFGIAKFINLNMFCNPVNGYLIDDACTFGVEVFVVKNTLNERCLSMINDPTTYFYSWKVTKFSTLGKGRYESDSFGYYNWNIVLYPEGYGGGKGNSISIYLDVSPSSIPDDTKLVVKFTMHVKDQKNGKHIEFEDNHFNASNNGDWGWSRFLSLAELKEPKNGFVVNDTLIIEAEVTLLGLVVVES